MRAALIALLILNAAVLAAQNAKVEETKIGETKTEEVGKSPVEARFNSGGRLRLDLCSGGIELVGRDDNMLRVSYRANRDGESGDVKVRILTAGDHAEITVTDCPHNNFRLTIEVPKSSDLYVRMFAGELSVRDITGDKDVELHFGQLNLEVGKPDDYGHVHASVNSGELDASVFNIEKGGLFRSFDHNGPGKYRLYAQVGAGEIDMR
jgi:hypothetical protein